MIDPFSDEQARALVNLAQYYRSWMEAERALAELPYDLRKKTVGGREYLYQIHDRGGNGTSKGPMSEALQAQFDQYREQKADLKSRRDLALGALDESCRLYRALRLPLLAVGAGEVLREADLRAMIGPDLMVIGTNAMPAYSIEAAGFIRDAPDETQDFDLAWTNPIAVPGERPLWAMLKAADATYTLNSEREFQARNARAYEVEILVAPSNAQGLARTDQPRPVALPEQEWLLKGTPVDHVVVCRDSSPARLFVPDPRWFALHKLWLSRKVGRNPLKRPKDERQGIALLDAVYLTMPQFALDEEFEAQLPDELATLFTHWHNRRPARSAPPWARR